MDQNILIWGYTSMNFIMNENFNKQLFELAIKLTIIYLNH